MPSLLQTRLPGCLIPAYWSVSSTRWDTLINTRNAYPEVPIAVVLNIAGGSGSAGGAGSSTQTEWTNLINRLTGSNIIVLGYVDTTGSTDPTATVGTRVTNWKTLYPQVHGILFDNISIDSTTTAATTYLQTIGGHARNTAGFETTAANCKVAANLVRDEWHSQQVPIDTFIIYDGTGLDLIDTSYSKYSGIVPRNQLAYTSFGVPAMDSSWNSQMNQYVGWIYYTSGTTYNSFPSYFPDFIANLNTIATGGGAGGGGQVNDKWGIRKMYHTKIGGEEFFTNQDDIHADATGNRCGRIQNIHADEGVTRVSDGSHECTGGSNGDLRIQIWTPAYSDLNQRLAQAWLNVEVTVYFKYIRQDGRNPNYVCQLYGKGGHHSSAGDRCQGAAYKFRLHRTRNEASYDKELCHSTYAGNSNRATVSGISGGFGNGEWHGFKGVQWTEGNTVKLQTYVDTNCSDSSGNLVIRNNWRLVNSRTDNGGWAADSAWSDCNGCGRSSSSEIMTGKYTDTSSSSCNYRRNACSYRTDGVTSRIKYFSAREIDPTKPATGEDAPPPPPPPPDTSIDPFGIKKIYPTITNGYEWFMNMTGTTPNTDTTKFSMPTSNLSKNADGSFKYTSQPTMNVYQRNGYNSTTTSTAAGNHATIASRGYMQDSTDWRNVECTIYVRLNNTPSEGSFQWLTRGGRHLEPTPNCEGSALRGYLFDSGQPMMSKEQWHSSFANTKRGDVGIGSLLGKWIGYKFMATTKTVSGTLVTNQQMWTDSLNNNTWTKIDERTDAGSWGDQGGICQGAPDQLISWGAPIVGFAWTSFNDVDFKNMSVREIDPNAVPAGAPPGDNTSLCGE